MAATSAVSLAAYLNGLDTSHKRRFLDLTAQVRDAITTIPPAARAFLYVAGDTAHPFHRDAREIFWRAAEQLMLPAVHEGELPLVFVGYLTGGAHASAPGGSSLHVRLRPAALRPRQALGFLVTDERLIARDRVAPGDWNEPRSYWFPEIGGATMAAGLVSHAWQGFSAGEFQDLASSQVAADLQRILTDIVTRVAPRPGAAVGIRRLAAAI